MFEDIGRVRHDADLVPILAHNILNCLSMDIIPNGLIVRCYSFGVCDFVYVWVR